MAAVLMVLCGLPASGKSHLSDLLKKSNEAPDLHIFHVCYDDHIPSNLDTTKDSISWKYYRRLINKCVEKLIIQYLGHNTTIEDCPETHDGLPTFGEFWLDFVKNQMSRERTCCFSSSQNWAKSCHVFLIDDNMFYRSMRHEYFVLARKYSLGYVQVFVDCPLDTAIIRNNLRTNPVDTNTIINMAAKMEEPSPEKYPWEADTLKLNHEERHELSSITLQRLYKIVRKAAENPVPPLEEEDLELKEKSRADLLANVLYQADQTLRKIISNQMKTYKVEGYSKQRMKNLAEEQNTKRKLFLQELKSEISSMNEYRNEDFKVDQPDIEQDVEILLAKTSRECYVNQCAKILKNFINKSHFDTAVCCMFKYYNQSNE